MDLSGQSRVRFLRGSAILAMTAAFIHNAALSWGKWGDLLIDCGMDLEDARMLLEPGHRLYINPLYQFGPLAPYFNTLLFKLFGVNSWVLCYAGLATAALMTCVLYRTARLFIGRLGAALAAIAFLYFCAFAHLTPNGSFNFVLSYRSCAKYGALLAMASGYFLIRHAMKNRARDFWIAAILLALAGLTKIESLTAATAAHLTFVVGALWMRKFSWKLHLPGYASAVALVLGVYGYFYSVAGKSLFVDNILQQALLPNYLLYAQKILGTDNLLVSLAAIVQSLLFLVIACAPAVVFERLIKRSQNQDWINSACLGVVCGFSALLLFMTEKLEIAFRFVPALALAVVIGLVWRAYKNPEKRAECLPLAILWALVLGSLCRMTFRTISYHYGFYLLPPALPALAIFMFGTLPSFWPSRPRFRTLCAYTGIGIFIGLTANHLQYSLPAYAERTVQIATARGSMRIRANQILEFKGEHVLVPTGDYWRDVIRFLLELPHDSKVLIVPHGSSALTFFCGLDNPYKDYLLCVPTLHGRFDDDEFLALVQAQRPDFIIRSAMDLSEYDQTSFGDSYSKKTWAWLAPQYDVFKIYGPRYIVILKRK